MASDRNLVDTRFPVQYVIRPQSEAHHDYRGYAGTMASGVLRPGDEVTVLPGGLTTTVSAIDGPRGPVAEAFPPMAVTVRLADDLDAPLRPRQRLVVKHTTRSVRAMVKALPYRLDVNTLHRDTEAGELGLNDIGRVRLRTTQPLFVDDYHRNRVTGRFILIDEATVGAGMLTPAG